MVVVLKDLSRISLANQFHAAHEHASGLENLDVAGSDFNTSFSQRVHDLPTETFPVRVRAQFDPFARAFKDSASLVWGNASDGSVLHDKDKN